jgi:RNA polymerase sigma factor (sigma-70 family)
VCGMRAISASDSYVFTIAANLLRDRARREIVRRNYREARRLDEFLGIDPIDPFRITSGRQDLLSLARAVANLPEKTREIFMMNRVEEIDKHTLAERFGLTVRMIEIHIKRALTALDMEQAFRV